MNEKNKQELAEAIAKEVTETILQRLEESGPTWQEPCIWLSGKDQIFLSLTEEDEYDQYISWEKFADEILNQDTEIIERFLPKFEALLKKMRKAAEAS